MWAVLNWTFCAGFQAVVNRSLDHNSAVHGDLQHFVNSQTTDKASAALDEIQTLTSLRPLAPSIRTEAGGMVEGATEAALAAEKSLRGTLGAHAAAKRATEDRLTRLAVPNPAAAAAKQGSI